MKITLTEKRFFEWHEDDIAVSLRACSGSYGGGSEVLVIMEEGKTLSLEMFHGYADEEIIRPLKARDYKDAQGVLNAKETEMKTIVRRLTPTECERLQGFPDGWTDLGEWTDTKGKIHKETTDGARYKALGNSIALPYWMWLTKRISAQYERTPTLGSLFDGIGGFPFCWAKVNGLSACIWASEIEEFPIAVTKRHFGDDGDFYEVLERDEKSRRQKSDRPDEG